MYQDLQAKELLSDIRKQCASRGFGSIRSLSVLFRGLDRDYSKRIDQREFIQGMKHYGITLTPDQLKCVFKHCDKDRGGSIDFKEFLSDLMPPLPECRRDVIEEAFNKLDAVRDGVLSMDDLKVIYNEHASKHPKVKSGEWTMDQAYQSFIDTFDDPNNRDGKVTLEEFTSYYAEVGMTIADDAYFELMMRNSWGLPHKRPVTSKNHVRNGDTVKRK